MNNHFKFEIIAKDGNARAGIFHTPHGDIPTPIFAPVGTQATVKGITPAQLSETGANIILSNTYHLYLRPGSKIIAELGGLHKFMNWQGPILTDSGGFQVFSLSSLRKINEDGVTFKSHIDGSRHLLTPEKAIRIQEELGADIIMAFDECASPYDYEYSLSAMERTHRWAEKCKRAKTREDQALFGIVQGGIFPELRKKSAETIASMDFPGNAIGGLSVGETKKEMATMIELVNQILPVTKPRYLMGVGYPDDLVNGIYRGIDLFDCVIPTRLARHKAAMTMRGQMTISNAKFSTVDKPIDENCQCYACQNFSLAYLRHLLIAKEILGSILISIHNIHTLLEITRQARQAIIDGKYQQFFDTFFSDYKTKI
ncbi:MAG: tRNA guanosine(34) transglycosylase Tgt [Anaerolineaceae bacterium]|nr:tRNA guanosine(34) transglycosylase Tgt [Anaerolineaceae bacterium]